MSPLDYHKLADLVSLDRTALSTSAQLTARPGARSSVAARSRTSATTPGTSRLGSRPRPTCTTAPARAPSSACSKARSSLSTAFCSHGRPRLTRSASLAGWTALSDTSPNEGTLCVFPDVNLATAYIILRPFFRPRRGREGRLAFDDWEIDVESTEFPGSVKGKGAFAFLGSLPQAAALTLVLACDTRQPKSCRTRRTRTSASARR